MNTHVQDWTPVVFRARTTKEDPRSKEAIKYAQRSGASIETFAKDKTREERDRARKLERDLDPNADGPLAPLQSLNLHMRKHLIDARTKKGLTQIQLANQLNVRIQVIQDLENGKIVNEKGILQKIRNVLGVSLRFGA